MITTSLVLDVRYDPLTSTFKDYSRNHHTITNNNVTPIRGKFGTSGGYDGITSYLNCGNNTSLNITDAITFITWIKRASVTVGSGERLICKKQTYDGDGYAMLLRDTPDILMWARHTNYVSGTWSPDLNWHHIVGVIDGTTGTIYLDGVDVTGADKTVNALTISTADLLIGKYTPGGAASYFKGTIDEIKIFNRALSAAEITKRYLSKGYYGTLTEAPIPVI